MSVTRPRRAHVALRRCALAGAMLVGCGLVACADLSPLSAPLPPEAVDVDALRIVVTNAQLQAIAGAVRIAAGKKHEAAAAPLALGAAGDAVLAAQTIPVAVGEGALSVDQDATLILTYPLVVPPQTAVVQSAGQAACALQWAPTAISLSFRLRFARSALDHVEITLDEPPAVEFGGSALVDPAGCLSALGTAAVGSIGAHLEAAVVAAVATVYVQQARATVASVLPPPWEHGATLDLGTTALRWQLAYRAPQGLPPERLTGHNGAYLHAHLDVGVDADRHPCAVDVPPPEGSAAPLAIHAPPEPAGLAVLRRGVVVDPTLLSRAFWALHRAGVLCRGRARGLEATLSGNWAADLSPKLAGIVEPGAVGARLWPGGAPSARVVDGPDGAGIELRLPDALLEVTAPVEGVEVVVVRAAGQLRMRIALQGVGDAWVVHVEDAGFDSVAIDSPILSLGELAPAEIEPVVRAVLRGIFDGPVGFPSEVPALVGTDHVGEALWLWLDGGALAPP